MRYIGCQARRQRRRDWRWQQRPLQCLAIPMHTAFVQLAEGVQLQHLHRHGVQHFVGEQHAAPMFRQRLPMLNAGHGRVLPRLQIGAGFQQGIGCVRQISQDLPGQRAAPSAKFQNAVRPWIRLQGPGQHGGQHPAHFRSRNEVAGCAKAGLSRHIIAQPRRVEGEFHITTKGDYPTGGVDFLPDMRQQRRRVGQRISVRNGQTCLARPMRMG